MNSYRALHTATKLDSGRVLIRYSGTENKAGTASEAVEILEKADAAIKKVAAVRFKAATKATGIAANFMSDAGTTALLAPIVIPMGIMTGVQGEPWAVGLGVAFATSFAHFLIVGTPNNAITPSPMNLATVPSWASITDRAMAW